MNTDFPLKMVNCDEKFLVNDKRFSLVCDDEESFEVNVHALLKCDASFRQSLQLNAEDYQLSW